MEKLIKSFVVIKESHGLKVGDVISVKKYQAEVPLQHEELFFENSKTNQSFKFKFLYSELGNTLKVHECFSSMKEKFDHIS